MSVAAARDAQAVVGAVYDPVHDEMFIAERGSGAFLNGGPIEVSREETLQDSIVSISWVRRRVDGQTFIRYVDLVSRHTSYFRRLGSAALVMCYVACGRIDAYMQGGLNPWDVSGGAVIVEEAGGAVTDFGGAELDLRQKTIGVVTANPVLHRLILERVIGSS